jgi:hypothetical protein
VYCEPAFTETVALQGLSARARDVALPAAGDAGDEFRRQLAEFDVAALGRAPEDLEGLVRVAPVLGHDDALGLSMTARLMIAVCRFSASRAASVYVTASASATPTWAASWSATSRDRSGKADGVRE